MSTLPLISHHLFVSAVGHDSATESSCAGTADPAQPAGEAPLEIIDASNEIPAEPLSRAQNRFRNRVGQIS